MNADPWQLHGIRLEYALNGQKGCYPPPGSIFLYKTYVSAVAPLLPTSILNGTAATGFKPVVGATAESLSAGCRSTFIQLSKNRHARMPNHIPRIAGIRPGAPGGELYNKLYKAAFPT